MPGQGSFEPDFAIDLTPADGDGRAVIQVSGELDSGTCEELLAAVEAIADGASALTLDLQRMTFIDSAGTRTLIMIDRLAVDRGISLVVTPPPEHVTELLRTAGVVDRVELRSPSAAHQPAPSGFIERTELTLPRAPHSPARARAEVRDCVPVAEPSRLANIVLLTSELVTNAVVHPRGVGDSPICLQVTVYADRVRVEVEDCGEGFEPKLPGVPEGERGRGLFLVDRFSDRWGTARVQTDAGPRFRVWFELAHSEPQSQAVA